MMDAKSAIMILGKNMKFPMIIFGKNKNSQINNNNFGEINIFNNNIFYDIPQINWDLRDTPLFDEIKEEQLLIDKSLQRTILINEKFEILKKYCEINNLCPIIRIYGCFTSLSSIQQSSNKSDLAQLELLEKHNLVSFIKCKFIIKAIVSLDINFIFSNNIYTREQYFERCKDLYNTLYYFKDYKNFDVVFDYSNNFDSQYILDTLLICKASNIMIDKKSANFNITLFDSDKYIIENSITNFDNKFFQLKNENNNSKKLMQKDNTFSLFETIYKNREENWFNKN